MLIFIFFFIGFKRGGGTVPPPPKSATAGWTIESVVDTRFSSQKSTLRVPTCDGTLPQRSMQRILDKARAHRTRCYLLDPSNLSQIGQQNQREQQNQRKQYSQREHVNFFIILKSCIFFSYGISVKFGTCIVKLYKSRFIISRFRFVTAKESEVIQ